MARRRIRDAERWLEENAVHMNPEAYRQFKAEVGGAKAQAATIARRAAERGYNDMAERRTDLLRRMCEVRDQLAEMAKEGKTGRIDAADYNARLERLSAAFDDARGVHGVEYMNRRVDAIADIELGPRAVLDSDENGAPMAYGERPESWEPADYVDAANDRRSTTPAINFHPEFSF